MARCRDFVLLFIACLSVPVFLLVVAKVASVGFEAAFEAAIDIEFKEIPGLPPIESTRVTFHGGEPSELFVKLEPGRTADQLFDLGFFEGFTPREDIQFNSSANGPPTSLLGDQAFWRRPGGEIRVLHAADSGDGNWQLSWHPADPSPSLLFLDPRLTDHLKPLLPESEFIGVNFQTPRLGFSVRMNRFAIDSVTLWFRGDPGSARPGAHAT